LHFEEIRISHADVLATVAPSRGALVSSLQVGHKQVLYLDRTTFEDPSKNVRGGIPVLFP
jgi:D-hexose-6-phosphate mutarotase